MPAAPTYDLPLVQRAFAEREPAGPRPRDPAGRGRGVGRGRAAGRRALAAGATAAVRPGGRPGCGSNGPGRGRCSRVAPADVRSWVVRELDVSDDSEPVAALTMRILDLRTPLRVDEEDDAEPVEVGSGWTSFARPA